MSNRDIAQAWQYHNATKHSFWSVRNDPHRLDWANEPLPFKVYRDLEPLPLPRELPSAGVAALDAIAVPEVPEEERVPDLTTLASLLYFSAGITKRLRYPGGEIYFRAAACTGALYHIDLYLVCGDLPGLEAGVYHFGPHDFALRRLRRGDYRSSLAEAAGGEPAVASAPLTLISASTFWRNAWKYRARTYRHCFWDSGTILANLLALASAHRLPHRLVLGFVDDVVRELLGLDRQREAPLALLALGRTTRPLPGQSPPLTPLHLETVPLSRHEVDYPELRAIHRASSLASAEEVAAWRGGPPPLPLPAPGGRLFPLQPLSDPPSDPLEQVVLRRGSARRFAREAISFQELSTVLERATRGIPSDCLGSRGPGLVHIYLIVNAVESLPPGAYLYRHREGALELLREGDCREQAGYLALEQPLGADASADIYFLSPLGPVLERFGNRGYRAAQMEAGIMGGKVYLAAYALRRGATGLTFYDDEVTEFFSPSARDESVMFLTAVGVPYRRLRS